MNSFEPKVIGFLCNWCSYAGADLAGVSRFQYSPNIRIIRVMCSTRISPNLVLEVFKSGADGVIVGGCHIGDCHYITGNYYTDKRMKLTKELVELAGIEPERLALEWISASEGEKFAKVVTEFVDRIRNLGPMPTKNDQKLMKRLEAAAEASKLFRLRLLSGKELRLTGKGNVYGEVIEAERMDGILDSAVNDEYDRSLILGLTKDDALSVKELASEIGRSSEATLAHVATLRARNLLSVCAIDGFTPRYKAIRLGGA